VGSGRAALRRRQRLCWRGNAPRELRPLGSNGRLLLAEIALK
jgi:hypothetical protein